MVELSSLRCASFESDGVEYAIPMIDHAASFQAAMRGFAGSSSQAKDLPPRNMII